ncbi:hypothetical protein M2322_004780 [Rhodoblastus acidophilus]|uniref:hypothetical protein n=1 Tax=Rhodoblastus acidophilus TaxID=1074 RepID=UPI002225A2E2|nr:hypothetical protein [Rhodoblastus acidophilus]MCW2319211.1 hypothetical protein [Rhodoblastus acidophilus]
MTQNLSITLGSGDAETLIRALDEKQITYDTLLSSRNVGVEIFTTIVLPITLTAVQVVATFLAAKRDSKSDQKSEANVRSTPNIRIGHMKIGESNFSVELIEKTVGRPLDDN